MGNAGTSAVRALVIGNADDLDPGFVGHRLRQRGYAFTEGQREHPEDWPELDGVELVLTLGSEWNVYRPDGRARRGRGGARARRRRPGDPAARRSASAPRCCRTRSAGRSARRRRRRSAGSTVAVDGAAGRRRAVDGVAPRRVHGARGLRRAGPHRRRSAAGRAAAAASGRSSTPRPRRRWCGGGSSEGGAEHYRHHGGDPDELLATTRANVGAQPPGRRGPGRLVPGRTSQRGLNRRTSGATRQTAAEEAFGRAFTNLGSVVARCRSSSGTT